MLFGIYSLLSATLFVTLDAVDVAFTEAAVGAGIATILMLATLAITSARQKPRDKRPRVRSGRPDFLDVAMVYALINFAGTIAVLKYFEYGDLGAAHPRDDSQ